jgi:hypothetical protein
LTALLAAAAPTPVGAQREWSPRRPERARASTPYLEADVNVAGWLSTLERQMSSGSAWPSNDGPNAPVLTGVSDGAAGIGFFFLRLNHVTRNPAYLGKARRAADYIASTQRPSDAANGPVQSFELTAPVAS